MERDAHRTFGSADDVGDLLIAEALDVAQGEDLRGARAELGQAVTDPFPQAGFVDSERDLLFRSSDAGDEDERPRRPQQTPHVRR